MIGHLGFYLRNFNFNIVSIMNNTSYNNTHLLFKGNIIYSDKLIYVFIMLLSNHNLKIVFRPVKKKYLFKEKTTTIVL